MDDIVDRVESTEYPTPSWQAPASDSDYSHSSTSKSSKSGKSSKSSKGSKSSSSKNIEGTHSGGLSKVSSQVQYMANSSPRTFVLGSMSTAILGSAIMLAVYCLLY